MTDRPRRWALNALQNTPWAKPEREPGPEDNDAGIVQRGAAYRNAALLGAVNSDMCRRWGPGPATLLEPKFQSGFDFDCPSINFVGPEFPLTQRFIDASPLHRRRADGMDVLNGALRADDDPHWDGHCRRADALRLDPLHQVVASRVVLDANGSGRGSVAP